MSALDAFHFAEFYRAVHGNDPFAWQQALAERVLHGDGWPEGIDVPTGLGKTSVIDVAVFALAAQAGDGPLRTAPTRTFVVVDRRVIVDQSYEHAREIAHALHHASEGTVLHRVATALAELSGGGPPLEVCRMRGGTTWSWRWLARPSQPAVVVATVDQYGSRLLFRGYGVGANLRPIDAALCGTDALVVLDEAHLSTPLVETLAAVVAHEGRAAEPVLPVRPARSVVLSATLPAGVEAWRPALGAETGAVARRRIDVERLAHLVELGTRKDPGPELATALAALAKDGITRPHVTRVGVVCNTVRMARDVFAALQGSDVEADVVLLIGRCRQVERDVVTGRWLPRLLAADERPPAAKIIAVATQTVEVGADFDFDLLVTEAAPIDALLQRLGRLDRFGRPSHEGRAHAVVVHAAHRHDEDPVYGAATGRAWRWLVEQAGEPAGAPEAVKAAKVVDAAWGGPSLDLGPLALAEVLPVATRRNLAAEPGLTPVVLGPVLDSWARTSPSPEPDQPVAPYLHGLERAAAEVLVCWRGGLPANEHGAWEEEIESVPVSAAETVSVPIWEAVRFLAGGADPGLVSDLEGSADDLDVDLEEGQPVVAVVVTPAGEVVPAAVRRPRPGDVVVVDSAEGGHDQWGWTGVRGPFVADVADVAARRRPRLRLRAGALGLDPEKEPDLVRDLEEAASRASGGAGDQREWFDGLLGRTVAALARAARIAAGGAPGVETDGQGEVSVGVEASVSVQVATEGATGGATGGAGGGHGDGPVAAGPTGIAERLAAIAGELRADPSLAPRSARSGWAVLEGRPRRTIADRNAGDEFDEAVGDDAEQASSAACRQVTLEAHLWDVAKGGAAQARFLGLADGLVAAVEMAGRAHDLGKADERFQAMLHGGDDLRRRAAPAVLAKSGMDPADRAAFGQARRAARWPAGMRHESISAAMVAEMIESSPRLFDGIDEELVLHLVQSHHGRARPLLPPVIDDAPRLVKASLPLAGDGERVVEVASDRSVMDWEGPARFAALGRRYGWWGLALLEAVVRLADMEASESYKAPAVAVVAP